MHRAHGQVDVIATAAAQEYRSRGGRQLDRFGEELLESHPSIASHRRISRCERSGSSVRLPRRLANRLVSGNRIDWARRAYERAARTWLAACGGSGDNAGMDSLMPDLLDAIELETAPSPTWSVLWLHGLGADGNDFAPIVPELLRRDWPAIRFVFPHAPVRAVTINNGVRMRAWYDIRDFDLANRADETGVLESIGQVEALISREATRGVPASRVLLAGFSQGGAITLAAGLRRQTPLAGLVALSSYLPMADRLARQMPAAAAAQPLFMAHGHHDPVIPYAAGELSAARLRALGFQVDWHAYPMAHQVCAEQIRDLGDWMSQRFAAG